LIEHERIAAREAAAARSWLIAAGSALAPPQAGARPMTKAEAEGEGE